MLGKVTGVWGVRGWIKLVSYTERADDIFNYQPWSLLQDGQETVVSLLDGKRQGSGLVASIEGTTDRDQAEQWIGRQIAVRREQLPELPEGDYYWRELIGLQVMTRDGMQLGKVKSILPTGANDVLVVSGEREHLVPYLPEVVIAVDLGLSRITVDWDPEF